MPFPRNFAWGAATAAYQIEGAAFSDGRGLSVWDTFCRLPGRVREGHTGETACDHYHRYAEDVGLMRDLGLRAYRFSISWSRVLPEGVSAVNLAGLDFYDRLVDELLAADIEPWATLFHWDYPHALYCRGGWLNPRSPDWFADYTRVIVDRLSDRVSHWITLNEPQAFLALGHQRGLHAPGDQHGRHEVLLATHHALLAHGRAVQVIREHAKQTASIGWAPVGISSVPALDSPADIEAARQNMFQAGQPTELGDVWNNAWFGDPVVLGHYPESGLRAFGDAVPRHSDAEMKIISEPIDFYGANIYNADVIRADADGIPLKVPPSPGGPVTAFKWDVVPECLYWGPRYLHERYQLPIVITENGLSGMDWIAEDGGCHDPQRSDYLSRHLRELERAIADGTDVRGYFLWSLLDNFEWAEGYRERFGLVHVDFQTQVRTPKDSAFWYRDFIQRNRIGDS